MKSVDIRFLILACSVFLSGCESSRIFEDMVTGPYYQPSNVFRASAIIPSQIRKVAVLPIASINNALLDDDTRGSFQPILLSELGKTKSFELVSLTPEQLHPWSRSGTLSEQDKVPQDILKKIKDSYGCDAVLFVRLTHYRAYKPLAIGWSMKLITCETGQNIWSTDEIFDSGDVTVCNSARKYYQSHQVQASHLSDSTSILSSPRRFAQYTLSALFGTVPSR